jgi:hypothetical protein
MTPNLPDEKNASFETSAEIVVQGITGSTAIL